VNADSGIVNGDSEFFIKIVHVRAESAFTINQNWRSCCLGITVHVQWNTHEQLEKLLPYNIDRNLLSDMRSLPALIIPEKGGAN